LRLMALVRRLLLDQQQNTRNQGRLKDALFGLVRCLTAAINAKDPYTCGHSERVARIAVRLGRRVGLPARTPGDLFLAGLVHDIGKIGLHTAVLESPRPLTEEDRAHVETHAVIGDRIIAHVGPLAHLCPAVRHHHERYDGTGYPDRLAGTSIPLLARILAVADACDAMSSARSYRPALPADEVDAVLTAGAGTQWDPEVIDHFLACRRELHGICQKGLGDSV